MVHINWNPSRKDIRKFGVVFLIGFGFIGGVLAWRGLTQTAAWIGGIAGTIGALAVIAPSVAKPFYTVWMGLAFVMGTIVSSVVLTIIFFGILTPSGFLMRLAGRDPLRLKKTSFKSGTYWIDHPPLTKESYERLF